LKTFTANRSEIRAEIPTAQAPLDKRMADATAQGEVELATLHEALLAWLGSGDMAPGATGLDVGLFHQRVSRGTIGESVGRVWIECPTVAAVAGRAADFLGPMVANARTMATEWLRPLDAVLFATRGNRQMT
jgi:hypothetical protein